MGDDGLEQRVIGYRRDAERSGDRGRDQRGLGQGSEIDPDAPVSAKC